MCWRKRDFVFRNVTDKEYMAGIHADVDKNTDMKVFIYDEKTQNHTQNKCFLIVRCFMGGYRRG